jgi:HK97 family phage prohead protease
MKQASYDIAEFKAVGDGPQGLFAALVSVFGNVDRNGDRVMRGAFTDSIERWKAAGKPIPVIWSHEHTDPHAYIGAVDPNDIRETKDGLVVAGKLDMTNPLAAQVYDLLAKGLVSNWSFAYQVTQETIAEDLARDIQSADLFEVGPTLIGANGDTRTLQLASMQTEAKAWDGAAAMAKCSSASDYRAIAFERANDSDPDTAAHWALPHHPSPGAGPDPQGVSSALGALNGGRGGPPDLKNAGAARSHLEAHQPSEASALDAVITEALAGFDGELAQLETKIGRVLSAKMEAKIRGLQTVIEDILSSLGQEPEQMSSPPAVTEETKPPVESELMRRKLEQSGLFLAERGR